MKHIYNNVFFRHCRAALVLCLMMLASAAMAQITTVHGTVSDDFGPLMGATVCEIDGNGRIIESAITDMNGNFVMKVKNEKNRIRFSYVGLKTQIQKIDKTTFDILMESATTLQEVTVKSKKRQQGNGLPIPEREISFASQTISTKDFDGLGVTNIDEALQGRIAGLDIVGNSGNLGSGSTMRLRGASSLSNSSSGDPLIVVDGNIRELDLSNFDASSANEEKFAELLNVNPDDIATITVKKDAASQAIYGSLAGNGVIEITTKRGSRGKARLTYALSLTASYQPKGIDLLSGDDYTMMLKESHFNPEQSPVASNIPEINYNKNFSEYEQFNNNTDWRDAVTQWGLLHKHTLTLSGGGEKATFRISGDYEGQTGTIIGQSRNRFSTRVNLDYDINSRIRVSTNFAMTYTRFHHNNSNGQGDYLSIAQRKMPNMGIYEQDADGNNTDKYYTMLQYGAANESALGVNLSNPDPFKDDQRNLINPVAAARLATDKESKYDITPDLILKYELLGMDEDHTRLTYQGRVNMNIFNDYRDTFWPESLVSTSWSAGHNKASVFSSKSIRLTTRHDLTVIPAFKNKDHSMMARASFEYRNDYSTNQRTEGDGLPSGGIETPNAGANVFNPTTYYGDSRYMSLVFVAHYAYKERYILDFTLAADANTVYAPGHRWHATPGASLKWILVDEPWMQKIKGNWLSQFAPRISWAAPQKAPGGSFLYVSKYGAGSKYMNMTSMVPLNLKLNEMKAEKRTEINFGLDLGFFNDKIDLRFEVYTKTITDMLMGNYRIPSNSGFATVPLHNTGKMRNTGWEFTINTNKLVKKGKFGMDMYFNFSNERNRLLEMDQNVLKGMNQEFKNENRQVLTRVQIDNPLNSIYGFRSKGVYQYQYETIKEGMAKNVTVGGVFYKEYRFDSPEKQQAFIDAGYTAPVALNADGKIIRDDEGYPIRMRFDYNNDGTGKNYQFKGGDAIYEDVNNDGQINALDIVHLGSSLPKLTCGFGFNFSYGNWRLSTMFNCRVGYDIVNLARLDAEAMINNNNQSQAVNYRWRKEGDVTSIPRAMFGATSNYNTLVSDRFVEDGSHIRLNYLALSYALKKKQLKSIGLNGLNFTLSAHNVFVISKYTGVDPDRAASMYNPAVDEYQTPRTRSYTFNMTVQF